MGAMIWPGVGGNNGGGFQMPQMPDLSGVWDAFNGRGAATGAGIGAGIGGAIGGVGGALAGGAVGGGIGGFGQSIWNGVSDLFGGGGRQNSGGGGGGGWFDPSQLICSDERLKHNVVTMTGALDFLCKL